MIVCKFSNETASTCSGNVIGSELCNLQCVFCLSSVTASQHYVMAIRHNAIQTDFMLDYEKIAAFYGCVHLQCKCVYFIMTIFLCAYEWNTFFVYVWNLCVCVEQWFFILVDNRCKRRNFHNY